MTISHFTATFQQKKAVFGEADTVLFDVFNTEMTLAEREALTFLYAYSPLVDISLSGGEFLLDNVRLAFRAREEMPWGEKIPEHIFRHFVLPVRGGKENLDTARAVFFNELKERVAFESIELVGVRPECITAYVCEKGILKTSDLFSMICKEEMPC